MVRQTTKSGDVTNRNTSVLNGRLGHLEKHCRDRGQANNSEEVEEEDDIDVKKPSLKNRDRSYKKEISKKKSHFGAKKMSSKARVLKKVLANLINSSFEDWDEEDEDNYEDKDDVDQEDTDVSA